MNISKQSNRWMRSIAGVSAAVLALLALSSPARATTTVTYFHNDIVGTPQVETDANGAVVWKESYQPFGGRIVNSAAEGDNKVWFADKPYDAASGLSYFGARYYDPVTGRFMGVDPVQVNPLNVHSFNLYKYGNNNPYKYVDPDGKDEVLAIGGLGILAGLTIYSILPPANQASIQHDIWRFQHGIGRLMSSLTGGESPEEGVNSANGENSASTPPGGPDGDEKNKRGVGGKGWRGDKNWKDAVDKVARSKNDTFQEFNGKTPTEEEARALIQEARGRIDRIDPPHEAPNPHDYPHINYTTEAGSKGTIRIVGGP